MIGGVIFLSLPPTARKKRGDLSIVDKFGERVFGIWSLLRARVVDDLWGAGMLLLGTSRERAGSLGEHKPRGPRVTHIYFSYYGQSPEREKEQRLKFRFYVTTF